MRIAVAVSGGSDSLLALALLKEAGHAVMAVHARFLPPSEPGEAALARLRGQCDRLDVELRVHDLVDEFEAAVVRPFVEAYARGLTPNPCAVCNPRMKFGLLYERAMADGAEAMATGHYARLERPSGQKDERVRLLRGVDPIKDQSYFLSMVPGELLARAHLPLGEWRKRDVPAGLAARGLAAPLPVESQEICFIPDDDYKGFLAGRGLDLPGPGPIISTGGRILGRHQGLWRHTIGQRRGLGIAFSEPLYVLDKDLERNALIVGTRDELSSTSCRVSCLNLLVPPGDWPGEPLVQTRYRQVPGPARVQMGNGTMAISFAQPRTRPAPGQVAAVYRDDEVLAGGIITGNE